MYMYNMHLHDTHTYTHQSLGFLKDACGHHWGEVGFGGCGVFVGVELGLHTRHRAHHRQHLVKYVHHQHLLHDAGEGGREGGREREEVVWRGRKERR